MQLTDLKGIGQKRAEKLKACHIHTPFALASTFPKRYIHRHITGFKDAKVEETIYLKAKVKSKPKVFFIRRNLSKLTLKSAVDAHEFSVGIFNQHYLRQHLHIDTDVILYGKFSEAKRSFTAQKIFLAKHFVEGYIPIYNMDNIPDPTFYKLTQTALAQVEPPKEYLPRALLEKYKLFNIEQIYTHIHQPKHEKIYHQLMRRLKFEELFLFQLKMRYQKSLRQTSITPTTDQSFDILNPFFESPDFTLTNEQLTSLKAIISDLQSAKTMYRLLQGDTGSGKTIVAFLAACYVMLHQKQVAFMAPTEILAKQHAQTFQKHFAHTPFKMVYLSQSLDRETLKDTARQITMHEADFIIGTHKLYSESIAYHDLAFVITDEQHRFGVNQRKQLTKKGAYAHRLHLSATPIPRTLAQSLYGDMDVSTITKKPMQQTTVTTKIHPVSYEASLFQTIEKTVRTKHKVFIVSPVIETSETFEHSLKALYKRYSKRFKTLNVGILHGRMSQTKQDDILHRFKEDQLDILIATTIIEVGIDFPNATLMIIYHAERFGFAQLHQLRGRVGRGTVDSVCVCLYQNSDEAPARLAEFKATTDGFQLSQYDLSYRGHGDLIGTLQSGYIAFRYTDLARDQNILEVAVKEAKAYSATIFNPSEKTYQHLRHMIKEQLNQAR